MEAPEAVIDFWFEEHGEKDWWGAEPEFDREVAERFSETHARLALGEGFSWRGNALGRLAEIIVLDQFSRHLYRNDPRAFAQDGMALVLAQEAIAARNDLTLRPVRRMFLYMPLLHSESVVIHEAAQPLFAELDSEGFVEAAAGHLECVRRFGRFPKRNAALGRETTPEEQAYLAEIGDRMF
ncbi:MAG TPA: DUF924 family protein [Devosiaceae bacterium]|nr:DUF924 family protein [Devosiaceae bacterium]